MSFLWRLDWLICGDGVNTSWEFLEKIPLKIFEVDIFYGFQTSIWTLLEEQVNMREAIGDYLLWVEIQYGLCLMGK